MKISGMTILNKYFHLYDVHAWGMFGTLLGYVLFFRFNQYFLMAVQTGRIKLPLPSFSRGGVKSEVSPSPSSMAASGHALVPTNEAEARDSAGVQMTELGTA